MAFKPLAQEFHVITLVQPFEQNHPKTLPIYKGLGFTVEHVVFGVASCLL